MIGVTVGFLLLSAISVEQVGSKSSLNEMADAQKACGLDGVKYVQFNDMPRKVYVLVKKRVYSRRQEPEIAAGIQCATKIVVDRGYKPVVLGTRK